MRAIQMREFGGPEVLELVDLPPPVPGPDEVLIEVARSGVNFSDLYVRDNSYLAGSTLPLVPGSEVAGRRVEDGARVVALCGSGGYAEFAVAPAALTFAIPDAVSDEEAVALLVQGTTAWHLHRTSAHLAAGESVLVHSGAGGVGSLAVQLARAFGAGRVIASASSAAKRAFTLELGAHAAIGTAPEEMTQAILAANDGSPVDVVLDALGGASFEASIAALAPFGRIVVYGISSRTPNELRTSRLLRRSHTVATFWMTHFAQRPRMAEVALADLFARVGAGELRIVLGGTYPLAEAAAAQVALAGRATTGKLLLDPRATGPERRAH
jgi:NADPH2:quinone reductase